MARTCIIGGGPTGSREHIFPASLGGRRTNKGIYCGHHNNGFSGLAGILSGQLKLINSLLGIRPDHSNKSHSLEVTADDGQDWRIDSEGVKRSALDEVTDETLHLRFMLGGPEGLRAIAYVALTFFAHHFPDEVRRSDFDAIKGYIQSKSDNSFCWWEDPSTLKQFPENPFPFGHTIALSTRNDTGEAFAYVSLFSALNFGVHLGASMPCEDSTVVVFIDPHADHPPDDIKEIKHASVDFVIKRPDPLHTHLREMIQSRAGEGALQSLFEKIEEWKFAREMQPVLDRLNAARSLSASQTVDIVVDVVEQQTSRIHRLLVVFSRDFRKHNAKDPHAEKVNRLFDAITSRDPSDPGRLDDASTYATAVAMKAICKSLSNSLSSGELKMEDLWFLFSGTDGMKIACKAVIAEIEEIARRIQNQQQDI